MKDIESRVDVELLVNEFYNKVQKDSIIGAFFLEVVNLDWDNHLPKMYNFWESILFGTGDYKGNPMHIHIELNKKERLKPKHFDRWKELWIETIRSNFQGAKSEEVIKRAESIAGLMQFKISET